MADKICGGTGGVKEPNEDTRQILEKVRPAVEEFTNKKYEIYEPVSTRTQVVAGINHFIKVKVSPSEFLHLRVYKDLQQNVNLHGVLQGKTNDDPLEYFDQNIEIKKACCGGHGHSH